MFMVISFMFAGIAVGYLFRSIKLSFIHRLIITLIWLLLFLLGVDVGVNKTVIQQFGKLGMEAFLLALGGTFGSVLATCLLWLSVRKKNISK